MVENFDGLFIFKYYKVKLIEVFIKIVMVWKCGDWYEVKIVIGKIVIGSSVIFILDGFIIGCLGFVFCYFIDNDNVKNIIFLDNYYIVKY